MSVGFSDVRSGGICDALLIKSNNPLASVDCDGDGMTESRGMFRVNITGAIHVV
ncbi:MAG: hypothetical protein IPJ43_17145 [Saprospiraceae bacterium]|nr:hypothetical protein [Saprospiraceae bacterium]